MRSPLRLGAVAAIGLGALLLATVLASPALAWHSSVTAEAKCLDDGRIQVDYTVTAWEAGHDASVTVFYRLNGERTDLPSGHFDEKQSEFSDSFVLPAGTTGTVTVYSVAVWKDGTNPSKNESEPVKLPKNCNGGESTTTTSGSTTTTAAPTTTIAPSTTVAPSSTVAPTSSIEETTTTAAVGAATSTTAGGGQLPFTGASSGPMLLAGIVLVGGGSLFLLLSRTRGGHATK
jgi:hypothetical protein